MSRSGIFLVSATGFSGATNRYDADERCASRGITRCRARRAARPHTGGPSCAPVHAGSLCGVIEEPHSKRHRQAAARHEEAAVRHEELATRFADACDDELAELERRNAAIEREAAAIEHDRAALFERRRQ